MIFLKNYFVATTKGTDFIPIIHDLRYAIRDSQMEEGLITFTVTENGAGFALNKESHPPLPSFSIPFRKKELLLAPKQMIYLIDTTATGKRREFWIQIMGETETKNETQKQRPKSGPPQVR